MITRHLFHWVAACLCIALFTTAVAAEELSLNQAVESALKNNPTIASGVFSADAARHAARGARVLTNPEISVDTLAGAVGADSAFLFSQPLEINGSRRVRGEIAAFEATAASFDAVATKRDIVLRVRQTYWEVARARELVRLNQDNLAYSEALSAAVRKQYDVGTVPGSQLLKTDVETARARQELAQAQLEQAQARSTMNALLNRPKNQDFTLADPLAFSDPTIDRERLQTVALANRPEIASAQAQAEASRRQVRAAQLMRAPDLAIQARRESFAADSTSGVAVAVTLPLFDWGSARSDRKRAASAARSQEKQLEAARNSVFLDVEQAVQLVETSSQIVREYQGGILANSEELAQMARIGYEKGATSYLEVLEAQRTLRSARTAYYTALANSSKSLAQLDWAVGAEVTPEVKK